MKKFKRILVKEVLIIIALLSIALSFDLFLFSKIAFSPPKYKLQLSDGSSIYLAVYPDITTGKSSQELVKEMYQPAPELVKKRVEEFSRLNKVKCIEAVRVDSLQDSLNPFLARFIALNTALKALIFYFFLLALRFILAEKSQ